MKKYLFSIGLSLLAVMLVFNLSSFKSESNDSNSNYILVEIYEFPKYEDKGVHIHFGNGKTEYVPFKEMISNHHDDNGEIILNSINKLVAEGYEITHTAAGLSPAGMLTKVFMRKK